MSKSILNEALEDAKLLKETAIENARNVLVEAISPQIREFVDSQLSEGDLTEMPQAIQENPELLKQLLPLLLKMMDGGEMAAGPGDDMGMGMEMDAPPMEEPGDPEANPFEDEEEEELEGMYAREGVEDLKDKDKNGEEEEMKQEETVKIDEQDLAKAWQEVVREESLDEAAQVPSPTVAPGFADAQNPNKNATGGLGEKSAPGERGLEDKEKEEMWKDNEPTYAQDWTVKEHAYKKKIEMIQAENKKLKNENTKLNLGVEKLQRSLTEVNLFNSKLLFTNKLLQNTSLTNEQRVSVIEAFDRAESLREVELVYKSLSESFKIAGVLSEGKQPSGKKQRSSRFTTSATASMLKEQSERDDKAGEEAVTEHWQRLAGVLGD